MEDFATRKRLEQLGKIDADLETARACISKVLISFDIAGFPQSDKITEIGKELDELCDGTSGGDRLVQSLRKTYLHRPN